VHICEDVVNQQHVWSSLHVSFLQLEMAVTTALLLLLLVLVTAQQQMMLEEQHLTRMQAKVCWLVVMHDALLALCAGCHIICVLRLRAAPAVGWISV
jgi:hypothetical protein